jgi:DNA-binding NarL/FixJ family response regulator
MRVILVGAGEDRDRVRAQLDAAMQVVAEFATLSAARASPVEADAIVVAPARPAPRGAGAEIETLGEALTPRELQVLELLAEGLPNKAIAARLAISDQTVKFHIAALSGKLGAANRTDAVRRAVRRGLIAL